MWIGVDVKCITMSKAEICEELPKLKAEERRQIYQRLCELQDQDLLNGAGPSEAEKELLDAALAEYESDRDRGRPWREVFEELRARKALGTTRTRSNETGRPKHLAPLLIR